MKRVRPSNRCLANVTIKSIPIFWPLSIHINMDGKGDTVSPAFPEINENLSNTGVGNGEEGENSNLQKEMAKRIQSLREVIYALKEQLRDEKELWRREIDELCKMQYEENLVNSTSSDSTVRSSSEPVSNSGSLDKKMPQHLNETSTTAYEKHLQRCHDASFLGLSSDYRQQMRRQLAAHSYKRKLMEVERMCNIELARVKQTASYLEPLNKIASEWNLPQNEQAKNQKFLSAGDIHYAKSNHVSHSSDGPENHLQLSSTSSDLPPTCSMGQLSISGEREHTINVDSSYASSTAMFTDKDMSLEQNEISHAFCECEDLPLMVHNKLWSN